MTADEDDAETPIAAKLVLAVIAEAKFEATVDKLESAAL